MSKILHTILPEKAFIHKNVPGRHVKRSQPRHSTAAVVLILLFIAFLSFTGSGCGGSVSTEAVAPVSPGPGPDPGTGSATLAWNAPTTNVDGSPLTDLAGYKIYYGAAPGAYSSSIDVGSNISYQINNLTIGTTYYFTVTAYNTTGNESDYATPPVSKTIN